MFSTAIIATDLGPSSGGIITCASRLGILGVREAVLVYAIDLGRTPSPADDAAFTQQIEMLEQAGIRVQVETPLGYPPHAIVALAEQYEAEIIVMGTRGQGLFNTGFSGSISSDVARLSPVPVLLLPSADGADAAYDINVCARMLTSVLVPVDVFESSERVCSLACSLAPRGIERMELLHITPFTFEAVREGREAQAAERLEVLARRARSDGVRDVRTTIVRGAAVEVLPQRIASGDYTLVVLAPRTKDNPDGEIGSVASAVIQTSSTPMLLAPAESQPSSF